MDDMHGASGHDRREVFGFVGAAGIGALALDTTVSAQPSMTTCDILAETLIRWGMTQRLPLSCI